VLFAIIFTLLSIIVTWLLYLALRPRAIEAESETADLRYVGLSLVLIILTAVAVASVLILGKLGRFEPSF
jgi:heme/copper-type cytochrome/quinol oxidase subunit 2